MKIRETIVESSKILHGNCLKVLPHMQEESIQCIVTSPPYWGMRDYRNEEQIGLEKTSQQYVEAMVEVFKQLKRVLRSDGVAWLNLGDSYGKGKQLQGIPWRVALALQSDGWILRSDVIWHKVCPMPSSVVDRPTTAHEYVFQLTKSQVYFYDKVAVATPAKTAGDIKITTKKSMSYASAIGANKKPSGNGKIGSRIIVNELTNLRSVWTLSPYRFSGAHFAVFPIDLPVICIKASTSHKGKCSTCGKCWKRLARTDRMPTRPGIWSKAKGKGSKEIGNRNLHRYVSQTTTLGWGQDCQCPSKDPIPCTVLDPFSGACTVGVACQGLGRDFIGIELNDDYIKIAKERLRSRGMNDNVVNKESSIKGFDIDF